jgi:phosphatidylinositol alpha-1,6-mannosyltransferase
MDTIAPAVPNPGFMPYALRPTDSRFPRPEPVVAYRGPPLLAIVVDAEEEFEWAEPLAPQHRGTVSIQAQRSAHALFAHYGIKPTYLLTYPLAAESSAIAVLREYLADGVCEIGAQLHPWVTPPFASDARETQSYPGNLPIAIEREKLARLVGAIETAFTLRPTAYKAGRYGFGLNTAGLLEEAGFEVDTSLIPRTSYADSGGPDFSDYDYHPFWFGNRRRLLELPVTRALTGALAQRRPRLHEHAQRLPWRSMHAGGLLARAGLVERITLSPEGSDLAAMCRLTRELLARGNRILTLSYHSPSLEPGHTPYVRNERDLAIFLDRLSGFLSFFRDEIGGAFLTVSALHRRLLDDGAPTAAASVVPSPTAAPPSGIAASAVPESTISESTISESAIQDSGRRCLVIANTFPPVHGGSAVVYDSLARFGRGRVSVLTSRQDYRFGWPIRFWREFDHAAPFHVHRIRLLRTRLLDAGPSVLRRIGQALLDVVIRIDLLRAIRRIVRAEDIGVVCIGELVASGWLAATCRRWFRLSSIIYVHGEEISSRMDYDLKGHRRQRALDSADAIVAVSRFTREALEATMGVPAAKITLISNGVDLQRFAPRPRRQDLMARYDLVGRRVLLTVGRLYARKGMDRVIESLPDVLRVLPDVRYLLVGDGTYRAELERLAVAHGVREAVVFAGAVTDAELVDHYALADAFIMANRELPDGDTEGFGLVFLEANACGIPVIAGKAGGSVDAVTDLVNGLVVDGDRTQEISVAILRLFQDDALREQLIQTGNTVAARSGWDGRVQQFLDLCDRLVSDPGGNP